MQGVRQSISTAMSEENGNATTDSGEFGPWRTFAVIAGLVCNFLNMAFVWPFNRIYDGQFTDTGEDDTVDTGLSTGAAALATLALFGMTVGMLTTLSPCFKAGVCVINYGQKNQRYANDDAPCNLIGCVLIAPGILWYGLSIGLFQLIAAVLITVSTIENKSAGAGSDVIAFGGFTAAWGYLTAIFSFIYGVAATKIICA